MQFLRNPPSSSLFMQTLYPIEVRCEYPRHMHNYIIDWLLPIVIQHYLLHNDKRKQVLTILWSVFFQHTIANVRVPLYVKYFSRGLLEKLLMVNNARSCSFTVRWRMNSRIVIDLRPYCIKYSSIQRSWANFTTILEEYANTRTTLAPIYMLTSSYYGSPCFWQNMWYIHVLILVCKVNMLKYWFMNGIQQVERTCTCITNGYSKRKV